MPILPFFNTSIEFRPQLLLLVLPEGQPENHGLKRTKNTPIFACSNQE